MKRSPAVSGVAVTGVGVVSPIGFGREQFWNALFAGRSGIAPLEAVTPRRSLPTIGAEVRGFAPREFIASANLRRMAKVSRMIVAAGRMALDDARLTPSSVDADQLGICIGTALGDLSESAAYLDKFFARGPAAASPLLFPNLVLNAPASYMAMELGATGLNLTVAQGEVSAEEAVIQGCRSIRCGRADVVLAGGGDELGAIVIDACYEGRMLAGQRGRSEWCSPYDRERAGLVLGEGAGVLVLESVERALSRGATVLAVIEDEVSFSVAAPTYDWPEVAGEALEPLAPMIDGVDLVIGSANSSRRLDACELGVFSRLFAGSAPPVVTSIKGAIGEFGAAGALSLVAAALAVSEQGVPPLCHLHTAEPMEGVRLAERVGVAAPLRRALVCGLARGGAGAALLLRRA